MKNIITVMGVVALALALTSCGSIAKSSVYGEKNNGNIIKIAKGDSFKIALEGNPTTGYVWEVSACDTRLINQIGEKYSRSSDLIGAGGVYKWTFQVVEEGSSDIEFIYHRPWEKNDPPIKVYKLTIKSGI